MYEFFVAFGHISINTKMNLQKEKKKIFYATCCPILFVVAHNSNNCMLRLYITKPTPPRRHVKWC